MRALFQSHALEGFEGFLLVGHAVKILGQHDVFESGEIGNQMKLLEDEADFFRAHAIQFSRRNVGDVFAIQPNLAGSRTIQAADQIDQSGFAGTRGPMIAIHSPGSTVREKSSSARMTPPLASALAGYSRLTFFSLIISLPSQDHSGLNAPQQRNRKHGRNQSYNDAAHEDHRQDAEARHDRRMKVYAADPGGDAYTDANPTIAPTAPRAAASAAKNPLIRPSEAPRAKLALFT